MWTKKFQLSHRLFCLQSRRPDSYKSMEKSSKNMASETMSITSDDHAIIAFRLMQE